MTTNTKNSKQEVYVEDDEDRGLIANLYLLVTKTVNTLVSGLNTIEGTVDIANNKIQSQKKVQKLQDLGNMHKEVAKMQRKFGDLEELKKNHVSVLDLIEL